MANTFRGHSLSYGREVGLPTLASAAVTLTLPNLNHVKNLKVETERAEMIEGGFIKFLPLISAVIFAENLRKGMS